MATRTNLCNNPALGTNATGWQTGSRVTGLTGLPRSTGYQVGTAASAPPSAPASNSTQYTYSVYFKAISTGVVQYGSYYYYFGSQFGASSTFTLSVTAGQVYRLAFTATSNSFCDTQLLVISGCAGYLTACLIEKTGTLQNYFDGDSLGGSWTGTAENSTSTIPSDVLQVINPIGIASSTGFGNATVGNEAPKVIHPTGIPSQVTFGTPVVTPGPVTIDLDGQGIPSQVAFGTPKIIMGFLITPPGIPSQLAFGVPTVTPGPVTIFPTSIASSLVIGTPSIKRIAVAIVSQVSTRPDISVRYDMVCVSRLMQAQGKPSYVEIDPLDWSGLSYQEALSSPMLLTAGIPVANLTSPVIDILKDQAHKACEIWLYRNGKLIFTGPWLNWQIQNDTLTLNAKDSLAYLDWYYVMSDLSFALQDQFTIAKSLVDQWQTLDGGNFGIDTSGIGTSGVARDANYIKREGNQVSKMLSNLGQRQNGFDFNVDAATRALNLYYPIRGVDRSAEIIFDSRNVTNTNVICSTGPQDLASEGIVVGTSSGSTDGYVYATKSNLDIRAQFGRTGFFLSVDGVSEQGTADAYAQSIVDTHATSFIIPGPDVRVTPDADLSMWGVGDTVQYELHKYLDIAGPYRVQSRRVVVSDNGKQETVTPTFV